MHLNIEISYYYDCFILYKKKKKKAQINKQHQLIVEILNNKRILPSKKILHVFIGIVKIYKYYVKNVVFQSRNFSLSLVFYQVGHCLN